MAALAPLTTAVFYYCDRCNRLIKPPKISAIKTYEKGNSYIFSWQGRSVTWEKECGTFRVSFNLDGSVKVFKEVDLPREHTCRPPKPAAAPEKEMADSKESDRPKYIDAILRSIRGLNEESLRALCESNLNIHEFRDSQGRSIFHLIAAECFNTAPANRLERQGKINLLAYLCAEHNPSTFKDAQDRTPLEWARAHPNEEAIYAFTEVDYWR